MGVAEPPEPPDEHDRVEAFQRSEFYRAWEALSSSAQANGLTEEILAEILAETDAETDAETPR